MQFYFNVKEKKIMKCAGKLIQVENKQTTTTSTTSLREETQAQENKFYKFYPL